MRDSLPPGELRYEIEPHLRLVRVTLSGPVSIAQIEAAMDAIDSDPKYRLEFDGLIDFREFSGDWSADELRAIAQRVRSKPGSPGARRAVVIKDDLQYSIMKLLEGLTFLAPVVYRSFRSESAALAWLNERRAGAKVNA